MNKTKIRFVFDGYWFELSDVKKQSLDFLGLPIEFSKTKGVVYVNMSTWLAGIVQRCRSKKYE